MNDFEVCVAFMQAYLISLLILINNDLRGTYRSYYILHC